MAPLTVDADKVDEQLDAVVGAQRAVRRRRRVVDDAARLPEAEPGEVGEGEGRSAEAAGGGAAAGGATGDGAPRRRLQHEDFTAARRARQDALPRADGRDHACGEQDNSI